MASPRPHIRLPERRCKTCLYRGDFVTRSPVTRARFPPMRRFSRRAGRGLSRGARVRKRASGLDDTDHTQQTVPVSETRLQRELEAAQEVTELGLEQVLARFAGGHPAQAVDGAIEMQERGLKDGRKIAPAFERRQGVSLAGEPLLRESNQGVPGRGELSEYAALLRETRDVGGVSSRSASSVRTWARAADSRRRAAEAAASRTRRCRRGGPRTASDPPCARGRAGTPRWRVAGTRLRARPGPEADPKAFDAVALALLGIVEVAHGVFAVAVALRVSSQ